MSLSVALQSVAFYVLGCTACHQFNDRRARMKEVRTRLVEKGYHWGEEAQKISSDWRRKSSAAVCGLKPRRNRNRSSSNSNSSSSDSNRTYDLTSINEERKYIAYDHDKDCSYSRAAHGPTSPCDVIIAPPLNDYHPPVVCGQWAREETAWMTLPPPTSEKMVMLQKAAARERSSSFGAVGTTLAGSNVDAAGRNCDGSGCATRGKGRRPSVVSPINIQRPVPAVLGDERRQKTMTPIARPAQRRASREVRSRPPGTRPSSSESGSSSGTKKSAATVTPNSSTGSLEGSPTREGFDKRSTSTTKPVPALLASPGLLPSPIAKDTRTKPALLPSPLPKTASPKTTSPTLLPSPSPKNSVARKQLPPLIIPSTPPLKSRPPVLTSTTNTSILTTTTSDKLTSTTTTTTTSITTTTTTTLTRSPNSRSSSSLYNSLVVPEKGYSLPRRAKDDSMVGKVKVERIEGGVEGVVEVEVVRKERVEAV
ncbi:hypothetical protein BJ508DRAFT_329124 [Ascobolus immersus RN42]|uniref:Uncharacterized protein n=1 Tax=Ascobolus immersus RN42 TaxID=1160509 RepID=A0A3N4HZU5_ASCIM|nr:hypothetical protein BJ508DRAFT_329124 [Ascobolus immersus RN42]